MNTCFAVKTYYAEQNINCEEFCKYWRFLYEKGEHIWTAWESIPLPSRAVRRCDLNKYVFTFLNVKTSHVEVKTILSNGVLRSIVVRMQFPLKRQKAKVIYFFEQLVVHLLISWPSNNTNVLWPIKIFINILRVIRHAKRTN